MWERLQHYARRTPLFGPLVDCRLRDHADTIGQTLVVLVFSTAPLWLGSLVTFGTNSRDGLTFGDALKSTIAHGELFMYGTALLAPIVWIALADPPGAKRFPSKVAHMVLIAVVEMVASVFFGLGIAGTHLDQPFTFDLSLAVFYSSLVLLYLGTAYHSSRLPDASEVFKQDEQDFSKAYSEHRQ